MSLALIADLEAVLLSYTGRWIIGDSDESTMSTSQAERLLADALARLQIKFNSTDLGALPECDNKTILKRLQCLYVMKSQRALFSAGVDAWNMLRDEIVELESQILEKPNRISIVDVSSTSIVETPEIIRYAKEYKPNER